MNGRGNRPDNSARTRGPFAPWTDPDALPLVRFEAVSKHFAGVTAVDALTLDIYPGEFFALLGPSGCGKTTLLRMLAGFQTPDAGRVLLDGTDITDVAAHRRPVNMMFQSYALFPHLTVAGNVAFGLKQDGLPKDEIAARMAEMLRLLRLEGLETRKPHQLSGGQRQRVALARALVKHPRVLLLDEPLAALDKKLRGETQFELMRLKERLGLTFVIVTHDQEEAMTVANRIGVMNHGRLIQVATPSEIYEQPNSRWVADFIGDVNLIEGRIVKADAAGTTIASASVGTLRTAAVADARPGDAVAVALRPEKIRIARDMPVGDVNRVEGEVWEIGYLGDFSIYKVRLGDAFVINTAAANVTRLIERPVGIGDRVWLTWAADAGVVLTQ
ncbi:MAG: polyamine ABC transporter ATP-binding protein [Rhizobiales bacterium]|nr:polyamine ABC transporter ATP-binding protein [Hyphomicrobiales bacterium]